MTAALNSTDPHWTSTGIPTYDLGKKKIPILKRDWLPPDIEVIPRKVAMYMNNDCLVTLAIYSSYIQEDGMYTIASVSCPTGLTQDYFYISRQSVQSFSRRLQHILNFGMVMSSRSQKSDESINIFDLHQQAQIDAGVIVENNTKLLDNIRKSQQLPL